MCHITTVTYLFIIQEIREKQKEKKRKIKSKKLDLKKENQNKISESKHTMTQSSIFPFLELRFRS